MNLTELLRLFFVLLFSSALNVYAEENPFNLTVLVDGATANKGQVIASLFSSTKNYLKEPIKKEVLPVDSIGEVRFVFSGLEAGRYAVSVVYDEDNNGELNTGFLGIPSELVGLSNNAKGTFGPPSFEDASFYLSVSETISIQLDTAKE